MKRELEVVVDTIAAQIAEQRKQVEATVEAMVQQALQRGLADLQEQLRRTLDTEVTRALDATRMSVEGLLRDARQTMLELQLAASRSAESVGAELQRVAAMRDQVVERLRTLRDGHDGASGAPGAAGPAGERGQAGERGSAGERGERGTQGERGECGAQGERGEPGRAGRDAADVLAPAWAAGVFREGTVVQHHLGQHYRALRDTATEPAPADGATSPDWQRVGRAGLRPCPPFEEGRAYLDGDIYMRDFSTFLVLDGKSRLLSARGTAGPKGERGDAGRDGAPGRHGKDGVGLKEIHTNDDGIVFAMSDGRLTPFQLGEVIRHMVEAELARERAARPRARKATPNGHNGAAP